MDSVIAKANIIEENLIKNWLSILSNPKYHTTSIYGKSISEKLFKMSTNYLLPKIDNLMDLIINSTKISPLFDSNFTYELGKIIIIYLKSLSINERWMELWIGSIQEITETLNNLNYCDLDKLKLFLKTEKNNCAKAVETHIRFATKPILAMENYDWTPRIAKYLNKYLNQSEYDSILSILPVDLRKSLLYYTNYYQGQKSYSENIYKVKFQFSAKDEIRYSLIKFGVLEELVLEGSASSYKLAIYDVRSKIGWFNTLKIEY